MFCLLLFYALASFKGLFQSFVEVSLFSEYNTKVDSDVINDYLNDLVMNETDDESDLVNGSEDGIKDIADLKDELKDANTVLNEKTLHVLYGIQLLNENKTGIIDEWEVNLKSVLSNAPSANDLHIHVLANIDGSKAAEEKIRATKLISESRWRNKVSLTIYNVESKLEEWTEFLREKLRGVRMDDRVSLGGYFRLLAHNVLKERGVDEVLYTDTDVVVLANLNAVLREMKTTQQENENMLWQYAEDEKLANSGFMVLNMQKFHIFWDLVSKLPEINHGGDQTLLKMVATQWPSVYNGILPKEWMIHLGHNFRSSPHRLNSYEKFGMLHFTGAFGETYFEGSVDKYCGKRDRRGKMRGKDCFNANAIDAFRSSWGLAEYYVRLSWNSIIYFESAQIAHGEKGHPFNFEVITV